MGTFSLTHAARNDLLGIARFTEEHWGRAQRRHYLKGLDDAFRLLANAPGLGISCDYVAPDLCKYPCQSHVVFYDIVADEEILVIRVLHKSMDVNLAVFPD